MGWAERKALIRRIEEARGSRVICYLTSDRQNADASISKDVIPIFFEHLRAMGRTQAIDVFIFTGGGDTLAAFGLSRLIREFAPRVGVLIPFRCHSAGTLLALSGNEVVMTPGATLTPIDPSIVGPLNPAIEVAPGQQRQLVPLSVETVAGFRDLVTKDWSIKGKDALSAAFKLLGDRVHPLALGDVYRARQQIETLARKLLQGHRNDEKNIARIVRTLTRELGSHDYPISRQEARELLGPQLAAPNETIEGLVWDLFKDYTLEMELNQPYDVNLALRAARVAGNAGPVNVLQRLAIIETTAAGDIAEREFVVNELQISSVLPPGMPPQLAAQFAMGAAKAVQQEIVRAGWRHYA